jgi:hypothetical protein
MLLTPAWGCSKLYQEVDRGLELTKFSAIPSRVPEPQSETLSGHVATIAPLQTVVELVVRQALSE